jgi:hypothetical protein
MDLLRACEADVGVQSPRCSVYGTIECVETLSRHRKLSRHFIAPLLLSTYKTMGTQCSKVMSSRDVVQHPLTRLSCSQRRPTVRYLPEHWPQDVRARAGGDCVIRSLQPSNGCHAGSSCCRAATSVLRLQVSQGAGFTMVSALTASGW